MSTTIDSLDIQITTSAGQSAVNIDALADALGRLKSNSKLTSVVNNLKKLNTALDNLNASSSALSTIQKLETAFKGLANIPKLSGLSSAVNALKKIPDVVSGLDTADLNKFTRQIQKLTDALKPLATEINSVANGFAKLPSQVSKVVTATNRMASATDKADAGLNTHSINLMSAISNYDTLVQAINTVTDAIASMLSQAVAWDGVQARFVRAMGENAQMYYERIVKINDVMGINIQQFMSNSSLFADMMRGFGVESGDASTMAMGFTELAYDIWAGTNDVFRTLEEAMDAVRSTIGGETESIQRAGFSVIESTLQETAARHNLAVNIEKATMAEKTYLRYLTLVDQAHARSYVGVFAAEMQTAEGAIRNLSQSFKTLTQAFGSLFIPILQLVIPYVTAFVEILTDATRAVAGFFGIELFEINWGKDGMGGLADSAEDAKVGLGGAADAAKKLKNYTMGFDELNVIDPNSGSGGSGGAGSGAGNGDWMSGLDLETLWDESVFDKASQKVDEIKAKMEEFFGDWKTKALVAVASVWSIYSAWKKLDSLLNITNKVKAIPDLFKKSWFGNFTSGLKMLKNGNIGVKDFLAGITGGMKTQNFASSAKDLVIRFGGALKTAFTSLPGILVNVIKAIPIWGWVVTAIAGVITLAIVDYDFTDIGYKIGHALGTALKKVGEWLGKAGEWIVSVGKSILGGIEAAWEWVKDEFDIDNVFELILLMFNPRAWIEEIIPKVLEIGAEVLPGLWQGIKNGWNNFWGNIEEFIDGLIEGFKDALGIDSPSKVFADIGKWIIEGLLGGITEKWKAVKKWFNETVAPKFTKKYWTDTFDTMRAAVGTKLDEVKKIAADKWEAIKKWYGEKIAPKFTKEYWIGVFGGLKDGFISAIKNAVNGGIELMNRFIGWINSALSFSWDGLEIAGKTVYDGGSIQLFTIPTIPKFSNGGFIEDGLFTMNSGEIAGKFNNGKSVVANNEQIIAGIAEGVYSAVVAAMSDAQRGGDQNVNVYLDGKQILASVKKAEAQRGKNLMGNQLGYSY